MESFLCYLLGIFPLWEPGSQIQLMLRSQESTVQLLNMKPWKCWWARPILLQTLVFFAICVLASEDTASHITLWVNACTVPRGQCLEFCWTQITLDYERQSFTSILNSPNLFQTGDFQWHDIDGLKWSTVRVFIPWKSVKVQIKAYWLIDWKSSYKTSASTPLALPQLFRGFWSWQFI